MQLLLLKTLQEFLGLVNTVLLLLGQEAYQLTKQEVMVKQEPTQQLSLVVLRALAHYYARSENEDDNA